MEKLSKSELTRRAKVLFFDKNPNIEEIYVSEYGEFSYNNGALEEIYKHKEVEIFKVTRKGLAKFKVDKKVNDFSKKDDIEAEFGTKKAKETKEETKEDSKKEDKTEKK